MFKIIKSSEYRMMSIQIVDLKSKVECNEVRIGHMRSEINSQKDEIKRLKKICKENYEHCCFLTKSRSKMEDYISKCHDNIQNFAETNMKLSKEFTKD